MFIHPKLLKAVRLLLDITQDDLAKAANVSRRSLVALEANSPQATLKTVESVQLALERKYGVIFLGEDQTFGSGFRLPRGYLQKRSKVLRPAGKARATSMKP